MSKVRTENRKRDYYAMWDAIEVGDFIKKYWADKKGRGQKVLAKTGEMVWLSFCEECKLGGPLREHASWEHMCEWKSKRQFIDFVRENDDLVESTPIELVKYQKSGRFTIYGIDIRDMGLGKGSYLLLKQFEKTGARGQYARIDNGRTLAHSHYTPDKTEARHVCYDEECIVKEFRYRLYKALDGDCELPRVFDFLSLLDFGDHVSGNPWHALPVYDVGDMTDCLFSNLPLNEVEEVGEFRAGVDEVSDDPLREFMFDLNRSYFKVGDTESLSDYKKSNENNSMDKVKNIIKNITRSEDDKKLYRAGFIDDCDEITERGRAALIYALWEQNKETMVEYAEKLLEEEN